VGLRDGLDDREAEAGTLSARSSRCPRSAASTTPRSIGPPRSRRRRPTASPRTTPSLLTTIGGQVRSGRWLDGATGRYPTVALGSTAAARLGITRAGPDAQVLVGGEWFTVIGILEPSPLAPELDSAALVGWPAAASELGFDGHPATIFTRSSESQVEAVRSVLGATADPESPNEVEVSRPSDALAAKQAAGEAFTGLLLGLGAVALLVGGVGVANIMVISCWNDGPRSASAAPSVRPGARSVPSSSRSRFCCRLSAVRVGRSWVRR
jgi:hypothetical protein